MDNKSLLEDDVMRLAVQIELNARKLAHALRVKRASATDGAGEPRHPGGAQTRGTRLLGWTWRRVLAAGVLGSAVLAMVLPAGAFESSGAAGWGYNVDGQLGNGGTSIAKEAVAVKVLSEASSVAAGELHSLALLKSGKVMAWGYNADGQLGSGTTTNSSEPVEVKGLTEVVAIAAGADHSLALLKSGKVMAWGYNVDGQLGNNSTTNAKEPVEVKGLSEVVAIAAGSDHSLAVLKSGKVMAWGYNNDGQLGNNSTTTAKEPVEVKGLTEAVAVAGGEYHSLALLASGKVKAWGNNNDGQLGNNSTTNAKEPVEVKGLTEASGVAAGHDHSLAVLKSGKVEAWGYNNDGQLGNNSTTTAKEPVEVKGLTEAVAVAGGEYHSLALLKTGKVEAWGNNVDSQLGNNSTTNAKEPVEVKGLAGAAGGIAAGANFSLASYAAGPANTELPAISGEAKDEAKLTATSGSWTGTPTIIFSYEWQECNTSGGSCGTISGATSSTYLVGHTQVGHTIRVKVTAKNAAGEAAATSAATATVAAAPPVNTVLPAIAGEAKDEKTLTASTGSWNGTPTITYAYQWQACNTSGESCSNITGATSSSYTIGHEQVAHTIRIKITAKNSAGETTATSNPTSKIAGAFESSGAAGWGYNVDGQLGNGGTSIAKEAVAVKVLSEASSVAAGELHSLALLKSGKVMAWGYNADGQLGSGTTTNSSEPVEVKGLTEVVAIAAGADHSLALLKSGKVMAWGYNVDGQLGNNSTTNAKEPVEVKGLSEVVAIAAGSDHSLAVLKSGKVMAWGYNNDGQLGNNSTTTAKEPVEVKGLTEAVAVAGGEYHSLALLASGKVKAWGNNNDGQLGNNSTTNAKEPVEVKGLTEASGVAAGHDHSLAVLKSGKVEAWGYNNDGQLGNNSTTTAKEPVEVKGLTEAVAVAGGEYHSLALLKTGKVEAWGNNVDSQLGNNSTTNAKEPVEVKGLAGAAGGIAAGANFSLASYAAGPANTELPAISGEAKDEAKLTATSGTWTGTPTITYSYEWQECNTGGGSCSTISGATSSTYLVGHTQVGHTIRVKVTAKNAAGEAAATSAATGTVAAAPPVNTGLPAISGEAKDEKTLTASTGSWNGTPTITYAYQWQACNTSGESCSNITGATSSSYTIGHEQVAHTIRIKITAKNSAGETTASALATASVLASPPVETELPAISGEAKDEAKLTATSGGWTGTPTITYSYEWQECNTSGGSCSTISGATSSTYLVGHTLVGHTIRVKVTAKNAAGEAAATSAATGTVAAAPPVNTGLPAISGEAKDEKTLTASTGSWNGTPTIAYAYQWQACNTSGESCGNIAGATSSSYTIGHEQVAHTIRISVTATSSAGEASARSAATTTVAAIGPSDSSLPVISGEPREGHELTTSTGTWRGTPPITYNYQWRSCGEYGCSRIAGATGASYTPTTEVVGHQLRVEVAATNEVGNEQVLSEPTSPVVGNPPAVTARPQVSGTAKKGGRLSASTGSWTGTPPISYSYQWLRCNSLGEGCLPIAGATSAKRLLAMEDVGSTLRVEVAATNSLGTSESTSEATGAVAESTCSVSWIGPTSGSWQTASDWSTGAAPSASDVACIEAGGTVTVAEGENAVGAVIDEGSLDLSGGSLELASTQHASIVSALTLANSTLTGPGTLELDRTLTWEANGTMAGAGKTVLLPGATASVLREVSNCPATYLTERTLINEGTLQLGSSSGYGGQLVLSEGARIENKGVFPDNSEASGCYKPNTAPTNSGITITEAAGSKRTPLILNTGTLEENEGDTPEHVRLIAVPFENQGTINGEAAELGFNGKAPVTLASASALKGTINATETPIKAESVLAAGATLLLSEHASLSVEQGHTMSLGTLEISSHATVTGAGTLNIDNGLEWNYGGARMTGTGETVIEGTATAEILGRHGYGCETAVINRTLVNDGTVHFDQWGDNTGTTITLNGRIINNGTFIDDSGAFYCPEAFHTISGVGKILNLGTFERVGPREQWWEEHSTSVDVQFENYGFAGGREGAQLIFTKYLRSGSGAVGCTADDEAFPQQEPAVAEGVCVASGDLSESQTDFSIGGRGIGLNLTRTYNSQKAENGDKSAFGYGWTYPYTESLTLETTEAVEIEGELLEPERHFATLTEPNGDEVEFTEEPSGAWKSPEGSPDILAGSSATGFALTLEDQDVHHFNGSGRPESISDRNGNTTTLHYNEAGQLEKVTDPTGKRSLTFAYNTEGLISSVTDPMGYTVRYGYENGDLVSVTRAGEEATRWHFRYESKAQLAEMTDARGGNTTWRYNGSHQVTTKTDPMERATGYEYGNTFTKITNQATHAVNADYYTSDGQLLEAVRGLGTSSATTESFAYDAAGNELSATNGDGHTTRYEYDAHGNRILEEKPEGQKAKWTYDSTHDLESETLPDGETTTYKRDSHGNVLASERPAPGATTQTTQFSYDEHGDLKSNESPLGQTWLYEYNEAGDRTEEVDPEGDKRTWHYNEDSHETETVSPRGYTEGAKPAEYTTTTERNPEGRPTEITNPLGHTTTYTYNSDEDIESVTAAEGNTTTYAYDADNERTESKEPNGTATKTAYDGAGEVISQTNGNKQTALYARNVLEQVTEIAELGGRKAIKTYDLAGNLTKRTDSESRVTTYTYNIDSEPVGISYSGGETPEVKYEYSGDGKRIKMTDGTGTTIYTYDALDRLVEAENGHKDTVKYEYNLANQLTKLTYPNGKTVTRTYDNTGRLHEVSDWLGHETRFSYDADSNLTTTTFPSETSEEDTSTFDGADEISNTTMHHGEETLASLTYTRNPNGEVTKETTTGLPGPTTTEYRYDENSRLTTAGTNKYEYDAADNPTKTESGIDHYNEADELTETSSAKYAYDEIGERTKREPTNGAAATYTYNQAGELTGVRQPAEGSTLAIEDSYTYDGEGIRTTQTKQGNKTYDAWDVAGELPLILTDGTDNFIYGAGGIPLEQISQAGQLLYLHHDQQESTRLATSQSGAIEGTVSYSPYGEVSGHTGGGVTPLGYDGQYRDSDTDLIYLRARYYDPGTGQFMSVDGAVAETGAPYAYAGDQPVTGSDPSGNCAAVIASINRTGSERAPTKEQECEDAYKTVESRLAQLNKRIDEYLKDEGEISPKERATHLNTIKQFQRAVASAVKSYKGKRCEQALRRQLPREAIVWAEAKPDTIRIEGSGGVVIDL